MMITAMLRLLALICFCVVLVRLMGCSASMGGPTVVGSGVAKSESRDLGGTTFSAVTLDSDAEVNVTVGPAVSVNVQADDNILPLVKTTVEHGTLRIWSDQNYSTRNGVKVTVTAPSISAASLRGSGNININHMNAERFDASLTGSGNITASGEADEFHATVAGSGNIQATQLTARQAHVAITGSGNVSVNATQSLQATITGSGDVRYQSHEGLNVQRQVIGSGSVSPM